MTVNILPDDVLLDVFDFYRGDDEYSTIEMWKSLVHACQRWRSIIFASPRHLCLVLQCDARTWVSKLLDTWPPFPIIIRYLPEEREGNIIAARALRERITGIRFEKIQRLVELARFTAKKMRNRFWALTQLHMASDEYHSWPVIVPKIFLCGSAPHLRSFT